MASDTLDNKNKNDPESHFVWDSRRQRYVLIGTEEDCNILASRNPSRYIVLPNN